MPKRSVRVYRNKYLQVISSAGMALCIGVGLAIALDPKGPPYLGGIVTVAGGYLAWLLGWQSSVRLRVDGVVVENMFFTGFVPWDSFQEFRIANGLKIVLVDGHVISSFAFGGSVVGQLSGFRKMRRVVERMEAGRQELRPLADERISSRDYGVSVVPHSTYKRGVRFDLWPLFALVVPLELIGLLTATLR